MLTDQSQMTKLKLDKSVLGLSDKTHTKKTANYNRHKTSCYFVECGVALQ